MIYFAQDDRDFNGVHSGKSRNALSMFWLNADCYVLNAHWQPTNWELTTDD